MSAWSGIGYVVVISPFSLYRLRLDHPPLNTVWEGKLMLVYWERTIVRDRTVQTRHCCPHSQKKGYRNSTPGVLLLQIAPFFQRGAFFPLLGALILVQSKMKLALGAPNYGQPNSTPRGAVSAPFFFWVLAVFLYWECVCLSVLHLKVFQARILTKRAQRRRSFNAQAVWFFPHVLLRTINSFWHRCL